MDTGHTRSPAEDYLQVTVDSHPQGRFSTLVMAGAMPKTVPPWAVLAAHPLGPESTSLSFSTQNVDAGWTRTEPNFPF